MLVGYMNTRKYRRTDRVIFRGCFATRNSFHLILSLFGVEGFVLGADLAGGGVGLVGLAALLLLLHLARGLVLLVADLNNYKFVKILTKHSIYECK